MYLEITSRSQPATDLGFLLAKHPERSQSFELPFGQAQVFYPEANDACCRAALLLDIDPIALVRRRGREAPTIFSYVNDRPYSASSFLSVALSRVFGSALNGRCSTKPERPEQALQLEARLSVVTCRGGEGVARSLFEPLGYTVTLERQPLDEAFPEWGEGVCYELTLAADMRLQDLLSHLYVLVPVLDDAKHYWIGRDEVEKLLARGQDWLPKHPERDLISRRYLRYRGALTREALARLSADDDVDPDATATEQAKSEDALEKPLSLNAQRMSRVVEVLQESGASSVVDLGCGEGKLLRLLLEARAPSGSTFKKILGMDVSMRVLEVCARRLHLETLPPKLRERIELIQGSMTYRDSRLSGYDAAALVEVIEHLDPPRLGALERTLFEFAKPNVVVVTTPNREYNQLFPDLAAGKFRHRDHRFEWTREEFQAWAERVAGANAYSVRFEPIGQVDEAHGAPTQMGVFSR